MRSRVTEMRLLYGTVLVCWLMLVALVIGELIAGEFLQAAIAAVFAWVVARTVGRTAATWLKVVNDAEAARRARVERGA